MNKIHRVHKVLLQPKKISLRYIQCHGKVCELLSFPEKSRTIFLQCDLQKKNFVKLTEKFIAIFIGKIYWQ